MKSSNQKLLFREIQHFRSIILWAIIGIVSAINIYIFIQQIILGNPVGNNPAPDVMAIIFFAVFGVGFPVGFYFMNLTTEVRTDGLYIRFLPFHLSFRRIVPPNLTGCKARVYSALGEYGGWGIRFGYKSKAYNVSGNQGVQLDFADKDSLLIGSRRPQELVKAINLMLGQSDNDN